MHPLLLAFCLALLPLLAHAEASLTLEEVERIREGMHRLRLGAPPVHLTEQLRFLEPFITIPKKQRVWTCSATCIMYLPLRGGYMMELYLVANPANFKWARDRRTASKLVGAKLSRVESPASFFIVGQHPAMVEWEAPEGLAPRRSSP